MINKSGLKPLGLAVLVEIYEEKRKSVIVIPETVKERLQMIETRAIIVEAGPEAWADEKEPRAASGDLVFIAKFAGAMITGPADGKLYRMINDRDVYAKDLVTLEKRDD